MALIAISIYEKTTAFIIPEGWKSLEIKNTHASGSMTIHTGGGDYVLLAGDIIPFVISGLDRGKEIHITATSSKCRVTETR